MSTKTTYTVVQSIVGENPLIIYEVQREQLTDRLWVCENIFHWEGDHDGLQLAYDCIVSKVINNPDFKILIFEGDSGYIFIFETNLTEHYETTILL